VGQLGQVRGQEEEVKDKETARQLLDLSVAEVTDVEAGQLEVPKLERFLGVLATLAGVVIFDPEKGALVSIERKLGVAVKK